MHSEILRAGATIRVGSTTLLTIERVMLQSACNSADAWLTACKQPYAVVIRDADGVRVRGIERAVSIVQLRERIPNLDDLIATI